MAAWDLVENSPSKWMFIVDTDTYAGNFERAMASYLLGYNDLEKGVGEDVDDHDLHGQMSLRLFKEEVGEHPFPDLFDTIVDDHGDDFIGRAPQILVATPGYSNDGHGNETKLAHGEKPKYSAFLSVGFPLTREPSQTELNWLMDRARRWMGRPATRYADRPDNILGFRVLEYRTVVTTPWECRFNPETGVRTTLRDAPDR